MNAREWKREFQAGKAARTDGKVLFRSASSAWQAGWRQQDELLRLRRVNQSSTVPVKRVVYAPTFKDAPKPLAIDGDLMKRRMMGGGRFVR